jgi:signal transduction histidine kinase
MVLYKESFFGGSTVVLAIVQTFALYLYKKYLGHEFSWIQSVFEFFILLFLNIFLAIFIHILRTKNFETKIEFFKKADKEKSKALEYISSLNKFKNSLLALNNPLKICTALEDFIINNFQSKGCKVFLWNEEKGAFYPHKENDVHSVYHVFDPFFLWLTDNDTLIGKNEKSKFTNVPENWEDVFKNEEAEIVLPLVMNLSIIGVVFIYEKIDKSPYTPTEREKLKDIKSVIMMSLSNAIFYEKMIQLTENLENLVKERTRELEETQSQLIMSEKMASLGVMVAGIAHEINTPSGVISNSAENLNKSIEYLLDHLPQLVQLNLNDPILQSLLRSFKGEVNLKGIDTKEKFKVRKALKDKMKERGVHSELIEDIVNFIIDRNYLEQEEEIVSFVKKGDREGFEMLKHLSGVYRNLKHIEYAIKNIIRIVRALKHYSHLDQAAEEESNIIEGIENTLIIMGNQLKHGIEITKQYSEIPLIKCNPDELNQVWTNIIQNAIHAMKGEGHLQINVKYEQQEVIVEIIDSGIGIPKSIQEKIWDPFFTTKDQGQGSGLGLGIVKGIIERHKGRILLESVPGNTKFSIHLPVNEF